MTREQFLDREREKKLSDKTLGRLTGYTDMFNKEIRFGDIVGIEFLGPNKDVLYLCEEVFTVTNETIGWLKNAMQIRILSPID